MTPFIKLGIFLLALLIVAFLVAIKVERAWAIIIIGIIGAFFAGASMLTGLIVGGYIE